MPEQIPAPSPRPAYGFLSLTALAVAAVAAVVAAWGALVAIERSSLAAVSHALFLAGEDWAVVETNGLQVILSGNAPSEAARFAALSEAGHVVDGARVIDQMVLPDAVPLVPPHFSIEMLRNQAGITFIGLIPGATDRVALRERMQEIDPGQPVSDFLETSAHPAPEGWNAALDFAFYAAGILPQSKISMSADRVAIEGIAPSPAEKARREQAIRRERPAGLKLELDIRSPHEVVSPFIMRFLSDAQGTRFDACTAHDEAGRRAIRAAGIAAGVTGNIDCRIGLGVPSPDWAAAVARGISAVSDLGGGALTFSDADITLIAPEDTDEALFDRVIGELEADLPAVFSLHGVRPVSETGQDLTAGPPVFTVLLGENGTVQLRGRVASAQDRTVVESLARAGFGTSQVYAPLRLDENLPDSWTMRTLAGLEALGHLVVGKVVVRPDVVEVSGTTGDKEASAKISRLLSEKLGNAEDYRVDVRYVEALDPVAAMPTPQECAADINAVLAANKIAFAPGSAEIERSSLATVDRIAEIVKSCPDVAMEIGGYTDSQGREEMNKALSQRRAEAVVSALLARRVLTTNLTAFGYGEEYPIADNDTEDGREANRRIEFSLVGEARPHSETGSDPDSGTGEISGIRPRPRPEGLVQARPEGTKASGTGGEDGGEAAPEAAPVPAEGAAEPEASQEATTEPGEAAPPGPGPTVEASEAPAAAKAPASTTPETAAPETAGAPPQAGPLWVPAPGQTPQTGATTAAAPDAASGNTAPQAGPGTTVAPAAAPQAGPVWVPAPGPAGAGSPPAAQGTAGFSPAPQTMPVTIVETLPFPVPSPQALPEDLPFPVPSPQALPEDLPFPVPSPQAIPGNPPPPMAGPQAGTAPRAQAIPEVAPTPEAEAAASDGAAAKTPAIPAPESDTAPVTPTGDPALVPVEPQAEGPAGAPRADPDMPRIRPQPRPPIAVHPELRGIRPRPRPAIIPDLPSTE